MKPTLTILSVFLASCAGLPTSSEIAPISTTEAQAFLAEYAVFRSEPDMRTVRSIVRTLSGSRILTRIERRLMSGWHRDPASRNAWLRRLGRLETQIAELEALAKTRLLNGQEAQDLSRLQRTVFQMRRRNAAWMDVYSKHPPRDYPFVLRGKDALRLRVIDGCTSASRLFCHLAQAAGIDARPVEASNLETLREIWNAGQARGHRVVNGHKMALVHVEGVWHLVNTNHFVPNSLRPYEIWTALEGVPVSPETLAGKLLRLPSMQVADGRHSPVLVVTAVGNPGSTSLGEYSLDANLNLAVSGNPADPTCRNPVLSMLMSTK